MGVHRLRHLIFTLFRSNTLWHEIFAGSNFCGFCDFSSDPQNKVPANKKYSKHFSRKNLLQSKYSQQPMTHVLLISSNLNSLHIYSTKKSCLFNHNLSLLSRNKTVNENARSREEPRKGDLATCSHKFSLYFTLTKGNTIG